MARSFVVEADGGSRGNPGPAGYGALVRDPATGAVLAEIAEAIGTATNNVAEYGGLIAGLRAAYALDPEARVEARMDSKLVVEQMSGRWQIKHPSMRPLALEARAIFPPGRVRYVWVPRAQNSAADALANEAMDAAARGLPWRQGLGVREAKDSGDPARAAVPFLGSSPDEPPGAPQVEESEVEPARIREPSTWGDVGPPTKFLLLRHGETVHTTDRVFSGFGGEDPPLTDTGRHQAARAAAALAERRLEPSWHGMTTIHAVVSSPLRRAHETARVLAGGLDVPMEVDADLAECAFGEWEGLTLAEVQKEWAPQLQAWLGSSAVAPPGGESFHAVSLRVQRARDRVVARRPRQTVVLVSHVTPIKQLVRLALGAPTEAIHRMELQPAALTVLDWYADGNASLRVFNDVSHLASGV